MGKIFPFPRPLEGDPRRPNPSRDIPVIGSFGFGTPGKGFELLVEAVNREFDKAVVRVNVPRGAYTSSMDRIHGEEYSGYISSLCKRIAKPGIDVRFSNDFMSPDELIDWCSDNDLNCFLYTRRQPGLSATTDQAIMSGRPLLTSSNDAFRHIHRYIPPYPLIGLRQAIETTAPLVLKMQREWSRACFGETFQRMLVTFGLISCSAADGKVSATQGERRATILVASQPRSTPDDICWYSTRVADCLGRSGNYDVLRAHCSDLSELQEQTTKLQPCAVIVLDLPGAGWKAVAEALTAVAGPKILLSNDSQGAVPANDGLLVLPRPPIIPYYTSMAKLRTESPGIRLIGFAARESNLEEIVGKLGRELSEAEIFLEVADTYRSEFEARVSKLRGRLDQMNNVRLTVFSLPASGDDIIRTFAGDWLVIFYNDPERTDELERISTLAMTTERSVVFTRAAPFPHYLDGGTYIEDSSIADTMAMGIAAQIKLCHKFGEGQFYARIHRLLSKEFAERGRLAAVDNAGHGLVETN